MITQEGASESLTTSSPPSYVSQPSANSSCLPSDDNNLLWNSGVGLHKFTASLKPTHQHWEEKVVHFAIKIITEIKVEHFAITNMLPSFLETSVSSYNLVFLKQMDWRPTVFSEWNNFAMQEKTPTCFLQNLNTILLKQREAHGHDPKKWALWDDAAPRDPPRLLSSRCHGAEESHWLGSCSSGNEICLRSAETQP